MIIKGIISTINFSSWTLPIAEPINKPEPTGGVFNPTNKFTQNITPKCKGSMPYVYAIGAKIGAKINIAGNKSITQPIKINDMFKIIKNTYVFEVMF
jgi:hypothetical protein